MSWERIGRVFCSEQNSEWMHSHAANPVPVMLGNGLCRIYFSCRDTKNRSHATYLDINLDDPLNVLSVSDSPVLSPGPAGYFDDSGISVGCIVKHDGKDYLYYTGWCLGVTVPFRNSMGLAIGDAKTGRFEKFSNAPIVDRNHDDPVNLSYPSIMKIGDEYRMWYGSNTESGPDTEDMRHITKSATSSDGIHWNRENKQILPLIEDNELGTCRPWVTKGDAGYHMWFSYRMRGGNYSIGYATSTDGLNWARNDDTFGLTPTGKSWESEEVCYPSIIEYQDKRYMFYAGNGYGREGFGVAVSPL